jgi:hypothetical protein
MGYDKQKIFEQAKQNAIDKNLFFIDDIIAYSPVSSSTFYEFYPGGSDELEILKGILENNRIDLKVHLRKNWKDNPAPALQMALMKLIATDDERKKLSMNHTDITSADKPMQFVLNITETYDSDKETD